MTDLSGKRFGHWTVLDRAESRHKYAYWRCQCDCGAIHEVRGTTLVSGQSTMCRKCSNSILNPTKNLMGRRFGHWTVLEKAEVRGSNVYWRCQCDCGTISDVSALSLKQGTSKGCIKCAAKRRSKLKSNKGGE